MEIITKNYLKKGNTSEIGSNVRFNKNCIFASFIVISIKEREGEGAKKEI